MIAGALIYACDVTDPTLISTAIQSLEMSPSNDTVIVGDSIKLNAVGTSMRGVKLIQPGAVWTTSNASIATVSSTGTVTGVGGGTAMITASFLGYTASADVLVTPPPTFDLTTGTIGFTGVANAPVPAAQEVLISNSGGGILSGIAVDSIVYSGAASDWLLADVGDGIEPDTLTLQPSRSDLPVGVHSAVVFMSAPKATNNPQQVAVTFDVGVGAAASIALDVGDGQSAVVNTAVAIDPSVVVRDAFNNPVPGTSVTFAISGGGGAVVPVTSILTDVNGRATVTSWTLGTLVGANALSATSAGLTGSPVTFSAMGTPAAAAQIAIWSGNGQSATVGTAVGAVPTVFVADQFGNAVSGTSVTFAVTGGGGSGTGLTTTSNASGFASVGSWTLGTVVGVNSMSATSAGLTGSPLTFTATGTVGAATQIVKTAGDAQTATAGSAVATAPSATVRDQFGNGVPGVSVTFAVTGGGGTVNPTTPILTNASGVAQVTSWTLGTVAGANSLSATSGGLTGSPLTFTATGNPGAATTIAKFGGDLQTDSIGKTLTTALQVRVTDALGNAVSGIVVTWAGTGGASLATPTSATNASGVASNTITLGNTAGAQGATATAAGLSGSPLSFSATATAGNATTIALNAGNAQTDTIGATLTQYSVRVSDRANNSKSGVTVTWAAAAGTITPSSVTNASGIAVATRVLGNTAGAQPSSATVAGLTGSPVNFTATANAGNPNTIVLNAGNAQTDTISKTLPIAYAVLIRDRASNPVSGATVNWSATGGTITPSSVTNASGIATATRVLGTVVGPHPSTATAVALPGSPIAFTATATPGNATTLLINAGDGQGATVNTALPIAPSAKVTDRAGNAVQGINVTFATAPGNNGAVVPVTAIATNAAGVAQLTSWTMGSVAKPDTMFATSAGLTGSPLRFTANAISGSASQMAMSGGNAQTDTIGATLAQYSVLITDNIGNPVSGIPVTWAVTGGGGSITPSSNTNASGIAVATRVLGTTAGSNTASASVGGLTGSPVNFTATANPGQAKNIAINGGNAQSATVNTNVATAPSALVTDRAGNAVSGVGVTFAVTGGGGTVNPVTSISTNASGIAQVTSWTMGTSAGSSNNTLSATSAGLTGSPLTFTASATAGAATQIAINGGNGQTATVNTNVATAPSVIVRDAFSNPVSGVLVTFAVTGGGGSVNPVTAIATNASGIAQVTSWTLGTGAGTNNNTLSATSAGLAGSPVGFTASATAGAATQIAVNNGNGQSATVNTNVATPPSVIVRDAFSNPVNGVLVTFAVTGGGGSVNPVTAIATNASGIAQVTSWTLGTTAGTSNNTLSATSAGLAGSPVQFIASGIAGAATQIAINGGNGQSATVNTAVATDPSVIVRDAFSNPVSGVLVTFAVTGGGGVVNPVTAIATNASGIAQVNSWTVGTVAGTNNNTLSATSAGLAGSPVGFTASANPGAVNVAQSTVGAGTATITACSVSCVAGSTASVITVTVRDQFANVIQGASVVISSNGSNNVFSPSASGTTNASGVFSATFSSQTAQAKTISVTANAISLTGTSVTVNPAAVSLSNSLFSATSTSITACSVSCVNGSTASLVTVTVRDAFSNAISGETVTPACSVGTSCVFSPANGLTNASGVFTTSFRSTLAQAKTLRAQVSGVGIITQTDAVTVVAAAPSSVTVTNEGFSARVGNNVTNPSFTVRDAFSNLVPNFAVSYSSSFSGAFSGPATTNASGVATLTSWTMAGTNTDDASGRMANNVILTAGSASNTATSYGIYTYSGDVGPLIGVGASCDGCHYLSWTRANIVNALQQDPVGYNSCTIANSVDFLVNASNANNSLIYLKVSAAAGCGGDMPAAGGLSTANRKIIRAWINNGALNN